MVIYDSVKKDKIKFEPIIDSEVSIYVCGPTVYDDAHLGHARSSLSFDLLVRILRELEYNVTLCKNFTDIEYNTSKKNEPYDVNAIDIVNDKYEVQSLYKKYKLNPQELELSPDYQRNFVWTSRQKSQLIESILIAGTSRPNPN